MADPIIEELALDIAPALEGVSSIDDALGQLVANFGTGITDALAGVASGLTVTEVDATPVTDAVAAAVEAGGATPVDVTADTTNAADVIAQLVVEPVEVTVDADTTAAQDSIDSLTSSTSDAADGLDSLSGGVEALQATAGLAKGQVGELGGFISNINPEAAGAVAGVASLTAVLGASITTAADAQAQNKRFADTFGSLAAQVRAVDVGGLKIDLDDLARRSGTTQANLEATSSRIGQLGESAGASGDQIVETTQRVVALGATVAVSNPRLGDAAAVTDKLAAAFVRGGRALTPYGINLSKAAIEQEALRESGKATVAELSSFDRITAGATLAAGQFGDTLGTKFAEGSQNAQIELRALQSTIEESLAAIGTPILGPAIESLQQVIPVAQEVGRDIGEVAQIVLPFVQALAPLLVPVAGALHLAGDGLAAVADAESKLSPVELTAIAAAVGFVGLQAAGATPELIGFGAALDVALGPAGLVVLGIGLLAGLGAEYDALGAKSEQAKVDTASLDAAFAAQAASAQTLAPALRNLTSVVDDYLQKQLEAGDAGRTALDAANQFGVGVGDLQKALLGTDQQFLEFRSHLGSFDNLSADQTAALRRLFDVLDTGRETLEHNAQAGLNSAVASGQVTQAQVDQALATADGVSVAEDATRATHDYVGAFKLLTPEIVKNAEAQRQAALTTAINGGALQRLRSDFVSGKISIVELNTALDKLNLQPEDKAAFANSLTAALNQLIDTITSKLPSAGDAIDDFSSGVKTAFGDVLHELGDTSGIDSAQHALDSANQRLTDVEHRAAGSTKDAGAAHAQAIRDAQADVSKAEHDVVTAKGKDADALNVAQKKLADAADPGKFIAELFAQADQTRAFLFNLTKLSDEGFNALAVNLAQKGPEAAGALADTLAKDQGKAKFAEAGITAGTTVQTEFTKFIKDRLAPAVLGPSQEVGNVLGTGVNLGFAEGFDIASAVTPTDADKEAARVAGSEIGAEFSQGFAFGIATGHAETKKAAASQADDAAAAMRGNLQSFSPSRATMEIGRDAVEGFALGLAETGPVEARARALTDLVGFPLALVGSGPVDPRTAARTVANTPLPSPSTGTVGATSTVETKHVDVDVKLVKTDPDPRHFGAELARQIAT